jgi:hypothetical protein
MRRVGRLGTAVLLVASALGGGVATARAAETGAEAREAAPFGAEVGAPAALLSRLHHAAEREVQLGELAEAGGSSVASRRYGAELSADFRKLDQRIVATAASVGVGDARLSAVEAGENVTALKKESDDFGRLANQRGASFDRDFWVTVAEAQSAEADMLTSTAAHEPALLGLVSEMSQLYDRSSRQALAAASMRPSTGGASGAPREARPDAPSGGDSEGTSDGTSHGPPDRTSAQPDR